jgi:hypothetical protein
MPRAHHGFRQAPARGVCGRVGRRGPHGAGDPERRGNKAFMRSQLWHPSTWDPLTVGSRPQIAKALERPEDSIEELEKYYGEQYSTGLY